MFSSSPNGFNGFFDLSQSTQTTETGSPTTSDDEENARARKASPVDEKDSTPDTSMQLTDNRRLSAPATVNHTAQPSTGMAVTHYSPPPGPKNEQGKPPIMIGSNKSAFMRFSPTTTTPNSSSAERPSFSTTPRSSVQQIITPTPTFFRSVRGLNQFTADVCSDLSSLIEKNKKNPAAIGELLTMRLRNQLTQSPSTPTTSSSQSSQGSDESDNTFMSINDTGLPLTLSLNPK